MSEEGIISRHLQKYVDKMEVWRSKQRYEDHAEKYESREAFDRFLEEKIRKGLKEARIKIERIVKMKREKNRTTTTTTKSSSVPFSPDRQFPYKVLKLEDLSRDYVKSKQDRASPLSEKMDWAEVFENPMLDLVVDVGCGNGRFVLRYAFEQESNDSSGKHNFLGLEIRAGLVNIATEFSNRLELTDRVCFLHANVTADLVRNAFKTYPGKIHLVLFQLPDPRLEKNLSRRGAKLLTKKRVLDQDLCNAFVTMMCVGSTIYLSSDYEEVFDEMCKICQENVALKRVSSEKRIAQLRVINSFPSSISSKTLKSLYLANPFGIPTEREVFLSQCRTDRGVQRTVYSVVERKDVVVCNN